MTSKPAFVLLITTDGSRQEELHRLIASSRHGDRVAVFLLLQNGANLSSELQAILPTQTVLLQEAARIPLSVARNRLLDQLERYESDMDIERKSVVLLADDDCWYPNDFFANFPDFEGIGVCRALDPETGKHFSTFNLEKRRDESTLSPWELMFYGVSISFLFRYETIKGMRFKENIGLGNKISQGEESLFVMRLLERQPGLMIASFPQIAVYHPWKFASSSNNHNSLGYFLGWSMVRGFSFVFPFYFFLWTKYFIAMMVRPKKLYWDIFRSLSSSFLKGIFDTQKIGAPNV